MRVYGDRALTISTAAGLERLGEGLATICGLPGGLARHSQLTGLLIDAAALYQGVADLQLDRYGVDEDTPAQRAGLAVLSRLARAVAASWDDPVLALTFDLDDALERWREAAPEPPLPVRVAEGFAHYAVYPEAYLEAARSASWTSRPCVIGLRSIGVALAPMVAAAFETDAPVIAPRPVGEPFARRLALCDPLRVRLRGHAGPYVVVDEGPGLSGSSFGAVGDLLEDVGELGRVGDVGDVVQLVVEAGRLLAELAAGLGAAGLRRGRARGGGGLGGGGAGGGGGGVLAAAATAGGEQHERSGSGQPGPAQGQGSAHARQANRRVFPGPSSSFLRR